MSDGTLTTEDLFTRIRSRRRFALPVALLSAVLLAGCASNSARAPVSDQSSGVASTAAPARGTYVVRAGDTLYKIAQEHGMDVSQLSQLNGITNPSQLAIGQVLRLDSGTPAPATTAPVAATPVPVTGETATGGAATGTAAAAPPETTAARASDANLISWAWPANGKIIQGFNGNTKGIDIEGAIGTPVLAAADGKVMYAGNGVRGLGNLILLGHSDGFITAYAHNQSLLVKTGASVKKGAKIATIGQTDTTSPRLHFEIRRRGTPVNPLSYLPSR